MRSVAAAAMAVARDSSASARAVSASAHQPTSSSAVLSAGSSGAGSAMSASFRPAEEASAAMRAFRSSTSAIACSWWRISRRRRARISARSSARPASRPVPAAASPGRAAEHADQTEARDDRRVQRDVRFDAAAHSRPPTACSFARSRSCRHRCIRTPVTTTCAIDATTMIASHSSQAIGDQSRASTTRRIDSSGTIADEQQHAAAAAVPGSPGGPRHRPGGAGQACSPPPRPLASRRPRPERQVVGPCRGARNTSHAESTSQATTAR